MKYLKLLCDYNLETVEPVDKVRRLSCLRVGLVNIFFVPLISPHIEPKELESPTVYGICDNEQLLCKLQQLHV